MVDAAKLKKTAKELVAPGKGILAMDESAGTMAKRLKAVGVEPTKENIEAWRRLIITTPSLKGISGAILYEGTMAQDIDGKSAAMTLQDRGIVPGVKLDKGKQPVIGPYKEDNTIGLDDLHERLIKYREFGARFAKWRSVFRIGENTPTSPAIASNAHGLAAYAQLCQQEGIVPIVEPEVLIDGNHDIARAYCVSQEVLSAVFEELRKRDVHFEGMILKPSMVTPGDKHRKATPEDVAEATIRCFKEKGLVPANVAGIAFLSGGQSDLDAVLNLNAMNVPKYSKAPWRLTFSYGRALLGAALEKWKGKPANVAAAQELLSERANACGLASEGKLPPGFSYKPIE